MDLIFESIGTTGDVAPLLAVARELQRRGHVCELLTNATHSAAATAAGVRMTAVAEQAEILRQVPSFEDYLYCSFSAITRFFSRRRGRAPMVVNCDRYCASNLIAERHGLPVTRVHLSPFKLRPYDRDGTRYDLFAKDPRVLSYVNGLRCKLDLGPVESAFHEEPYVLRHVAAFPEWLCSPALVAAPPLHFVDFPLPAEHAALPAPLRDLVARAGKPLVFTYGTANDDLDGFIAGAERCCNRLESPGVVLCPRGVGERRSSARLLLCPYVPLSRILAKARLLVHHGGIGTAARALAAGVPQVIIPQRFDQPDNGARLERLGVARVLDARAFAAGALSTTVRELLEDGDVAKRLEVLRQRVERTDAVKNWADLLERDLDAVA